MRVLSKPFAAPPAKDQISLGKIEKRADGRPHPEHLCVDDTQRRCHTYIIGQTGSGKSQFIVHNVCSNIVRNYPCAVIDPVGGLFRPILQFLGEANLRLAMQERSAYAGWNREKRLKRMAWIRRFVILDFTHPEIWGWRYNPLEPQDGLTVDETVADLLRCFQRVIGDLNEMRRLQLVLRAVFTLVAESGGVIRDALDYLVMDGEDIQADVRRIEQRRGGNMRRDLVHTYLTTLYAATSGRERRELTSSAWHAVSVFLSDPIVARFVSEPRGNVSFSDVVNGGKWLFVHLPQGLDLNTTTVIGALIANRIQLVCERRKQADIQAKRVPDFGLIIDEFQLLFGREFAESIARVRNVRLNYTLSHQAGTQPPFDSQDGRALLRAVRANCATQLFFRLDALDADECARRVFRPRGMLLKRDEEQTTETRTESWAESVSKSVSRSISHAFGESVGITKTISIGESRSVGYSKANGISRVETESMSVAQGESWSRATNKSTGMTVTVTDSQTIVEGKGTAKGYSRGDSSGVDHASGAVTHAVNKTISHSESASKGRSLARGESRTEGSSSSEGGSTTTSTGSAIAKGLSEVQSAMNSLSRTLTVGEALARSYSKTTTHGRSVGVSVGFQRGGSYSRGTTRVREYFSLDEELQLQANALADLPRRQAWAWVNDAESAAYLISTHDVPQSFRTTLGGHDYLEEFLRVAAAPQAAPTTGTTAALVEPAPRPRRRGLP